MNKYESEAFQNAYTFADKAEEILDVSGAKAELSLVENGELHFGAIASRGFDIVDGATVAAMLINLFMWIGQIRNGQILNNASREEIIKDLSIRVLDNDSLSASAKERLLLKAFEQLSPDGN